MSIRINDQWRIGFFWENESAGDIEIVDYHYTNESETTEAGASG
jgi:hypothetical protein